MRQNNAELFDTSNTFALRGEALDNSITAEGQARAAAEAASEARKAQRTFLYVADKGETVIEFPLVRQYPDHDDTNENAL